VICPVCGDYCSVEVACKGCNEVWQEDTRHQALEAIGWRLKYSAFGKLRSAFEDGDSEFIIQHFMDRIESGDMIDEQEWLKTQEVKA
tara:strand:+ start:864 stop:1124 length:261 start_codon:yes stop_codon:yes gene_type:complete